MGSKKHKKHKSERREKYEGELQRLLYVYVVYDALVLHRV